jgi:uncharacterized protein involved in type VI secretion and phage assembly
MGGVMSEDVIALILEWVRGRYFGKYRGTVTSNSDPASRGRLKVKVPAVLEDLEVWAQPCVPYAGKDVGFLALPPEKAGVWVEFEAGDPSFPIWAGCFWADNEAPEQANPDIKAWITQSNRIRLDDKQNEALVKNGNGVSVTLAADATTKAGEMTHVVSKSGITSDAGHGKVEVTSSSVKVNGGALEVD